MKKIKLSIIVSVVFSFLLAGLSCVTDANYETCNIFCEDGYGGFTQRAYPNLTDQECLDKPRSGQCTVSMCKSQTDCRQLFP